MPRNELALETPAEAITVSVDGRVHHGAFRSGRGYVMLQSAYGRATAPRGRLSARQVAEMLLQRLVREHPVRPPDGV